MHTIFSVSNNIFESLSPIAAVKVFRNLLWCESQRMGIPPHKIVISLDTTIADGGIDAKIECVPKSASLLINGESYFQIKTGKSFKPWLAPHLKKELFGKSNASPQKQLLGDAVKNCLERNGRYILVVFGYDLTPLQHSRAKQALEGLLRNCGYAEPLIDVIGQGQLIGEFAQFPSLCLDLLDKSEFAFQTVRSWKTNNDMTFPLHAGETQEKFIDEIRGLLRGDEFQHVRIIGEPGIGKTRLVLEAVSADDLAPSTVYIPHAEDFQRGQFFNELLRPDRQYFTCLVIDECGEKDRASIWSALKGKVNIKLVTIDHGPEYSADSSMKILNCPMLPDKQISEIIASYTGSLRDLSNWAQWCSGSPRVAHAVGENLKYNPEDILKPPATVPIWDRFVLGHRSRDSKEADQHFIVLRHLALFQRFGFESPVDDEARFISELVKEADSSITWAKFQSIVRYHRDRRILQGKRTLFIVPKALHVHLWLSYWENYGRGFNFQEFFAKMPSQLHRWFFELFIYAHANPVASQVVREILCPVRGPFSKQEFLVSEAGTRFLSYLAEADPSATLALLEATLGKWSLEELRGWSIGRQNIVWALEKIAVWKEIFTRTAKLLVRMALAENATNSNNSKGILLDLFAIGLGWAPTEATPEQRFSIIEELLQNKDSAMRELGLELCKKWLSTYGGFRIIGAEYQGLRPTVEFWRPKTYGEVFDCWREVWGFLYKETRGWDEVERSKANSTIIESASGLLYVQAIAEEIVNTLFDIVKDSATDKAKMIKFVNRELKFRSEKLPKGIVAKLKSLDKALTGDSFCDRFSRYVLFTDWDEDYEYKNAKIINKTRPRKMVLELVKEVTENHSLLEEHFSRFVTSEGHRLYEFGRELALKLADRIWDSRIIDAQESALPAMKTQFLGGYLGGIKEQDYAAWEGIIINLIKSDVLRLVGIDAIFRSGTSERIVKELLKFYRKGKTPSYAFRHLWWHADKNIISQQLLEEVLSLIIEQPDDGSPSVAIDLPDQYFVRNKSNYILPESLIFKLLTAKEFFSKNEDDMMGYHWHNVAKGFREQYPAKDIELFSIILENMKNLSSLHSLSYPSQIASEIARTHPVETWKLVCEQLEKNDENSYYVLGWLGDEISFEEDENHGAIRFFDPHLVIDWIRNSSKRIHLISRCLPKTLDIDKGGAVVRLYIETFCDDEDIAKTLRYFFTAGGWSGPESNYLMRKRDKARQWVSEIQSSKIQAWLSLYIDYLTERITRAEIEEERRL